MTRRAPARPGMALLTTLLGVLVLEIVVAGAFHVAMQQRRIATAYTRGVQLQVAARSTLADALAGWSAIATDSLAVGATLPVRDRTIGGVSSLATLRRVATGLFLLRAEARFAATGEAHAVAAILREYTLPEFLAGIGAVVVARSATVQGAVGGTAPPECDLPDGAPAALPALLLPASSGTETFDHMEVAGLDLSAVSEALPGVRVVRGDLSLAADLDETVLVVHGNAEVPPDVTFRGLLLVGGSLHLQPGARVLGAARVADSLVLVDGELRYDPCVLAALFQARSFLRGPLRAAPHWWIPAA